MHEAGAAGEEGSHPCQAGAGGREADLLCKEPRGEKSAGHRWHCTGFQWGDARRGSYERKGCGG